MSTVDHTESSTPAAEIAYERMVAAIELETTGASPYPRGTAFVGADMPELSSVLLDYARERRPTLLVFPDGDERLIRWETPRAPSFGTALFRSALRRLSHVR